jgi:hypothetical protein
MKTISKISVLAILLVSATTHAGDPKEEEVLEKVFPSFNSGVVVQGAAITWHNYVQWWNKTQGTPLRGDIELGTNLWADGIARLKPEYVYTHGVNIVIVRSSRHGEDEEGFYVVLTIASSPGPNDEQFTRMLIAPHALGNVFTFRRRGHFERTPAEKQQEVAPNKASEAIGVPSAPQPQRKR